MKSVLSVFKAKPAFKSVVDAFVATTSLVAFNCLPVTASVDAISKVASCRLVILVPVVPPARVIFALFEPVSYNTVSALGAIELSALSTYFLFAASVAFTASATLVIRFSAPALPTETVFSSLATEL